MITVKTKQKLEQVVNNNSGKGVFQTDKDLFSIVINSVPIGYIVCVVFGIGSWKQSFVFLIALCVSYIIGKMMSLKTYNKMAKYSLVLSVVYIVFRGLIAMISAMCEL